MGGKTELRTALGPDYRTALKTLPGAVAALQHQIALGEHRASQCWRTIHGYRTLSTFPPQIASRDYQARLAFAAEIRAHFHG